MGKYENYIPENINLDEMVYKNRPKFKPFKRDKLAYIVSLLHEIPLYKEEYRETGYIPLNSTVLKRKITNYKDYLKYLEFDLEIIESDRHYIVGEKSIGYRLKNEFKTKIKAVDMQDFVMLKQLKIETLNNLITLKKYSYLSKWLKNGIEINFKKVEEFLEEEHELMEAFQEENAILKHNLSFISARKIHVKNINAKIDDNINRLHSNLTNLRSELRNALTYNGEQLISIDLKNSQPFISLSIFNKKILEILKLEYNHYSIMLGEKLESIDIKGFEHFCKLVETGLLYEFLQKEYEEKLGMVFKSRKEIKSLVFQVIFTDNRFIGQKEAAPKKIFKNLFPEVYRVFSEIKRKDKTMLPRLLQYAESQLFLNLISKRISREFPNAPILTIHDSIATTLKYKENVFKIIEEELTANIGFKPTLSVDLWNIEKLDDYLISLKGNNNMVG